MQTNNGSESPSDPTLINDLLRQSSFASIVQKAQRLHKIDQILPALLPGGFAPHCHVMNLREETLVIKVDNSAIATRLRYLESKIIDQMQPFPELQSVSRIQLHVRPTISLEK